MASGIYAVVHIGQLKVYVCEAGAIHRNWPVLLAQLTQGTHPNAELQQAWNQEGGKRYFTFHTRKDLESDREILEIEKLTEESASITYKRDSQQ